MITGREAPTELSVELVPLDEVPELALRILSLGAPAEAAALMVDRYPERVPGNQFLEDVAQAIKEGEELERARTVELAVERARARAERTGEVSDPEERLQDYLASSVMRIIGVTKADTKVVLASNIERHLTALNRELNPSRWQGYRKDMEQGRWWTVPDAVVITDTGQIINGQHRLVAALYADLDSSKYPEGIPSFVVVWNVDKKAALIMDEARRTPGDRRQIAIASA